MNTTNTTPHEWMDEARCAEISPDLFFPDKGENPHDVIAICHQCDVRQQCLQYALENGIVDGIFGGLTGHGRRYLARPDQRRKTSPEAIRKAHADGLSDSLIAERVGITDTHARRLRIELGLEANKHVA